MMQNIYDNMKCELVHQKIKSFGGIQKTWLHTRLDFVPI